MPERNQKEPLKFSGLVRPLKPSDLSFLRSILSHWIKDRDTGEFLPVEVNKTLMAMGESTVKLNGRNFLVAENAGEVVGVIGLKEPDAVMKTFAATQNPAELINAYVRPDMRGGFGVGTALLASLEECAKEKGHGEILLNSGPRYKDTGWGFYDKTGFDRVGVIVEYYGVGGNAQVWRKIL